MSTPQPPAGGQPQDPNQPPQYQPQQYQQPQYQPQQQYQQPPAGYQQPAAAVPVKPKRPWNVTLVALLALLLALLDIAIGVITLINRDNVDFAAQVGTSRSNLLYVGITAVVVGAIVLLLSFGLFGGSRLARGVIAFFCVLHLAATAIVLIVSTSTNTRIAQSVDALIAIIMLMLLYAGARTKLFFARG